MDYNELEKCTVGKLREMLKEQDPDFKGASSMKKAELVEVLAGKLGLESSGSDAPAPKAEKAPPVKKSPAKKGAKKKPGQPRDKATIKAEIKKLKAAKLNASGDRAKLDQLRVDMHALRRELKKAVKKSA